MHTVIGEVSIEEAMATLNVFYSGKGCGREGQGANKVNTVCGAFLEMVLRFGHLRTNIEGPTVIAGRGTSDFPWEGKPR
jgi:hypothetical protein